MNYARLAIATAVENADAATGAGNSKTCKIFAAQIQIFNKFTNPSPTEATLSKITTQNIKVINPWDDDVTIGAQYAVGQLIDETWVRLPSGSTSPSPPAPRIQFRFASQVGAAEDGRWYATALLVEGGTAVNPLDPQNPITPGSTFIVHDPHRHFTWPTLHNQLPAAAIADGFTGSIGWAYLRTPTTSEDNPQDMERWEVEQSSLAINRMRVYIDRCLLWNTEDRSAYFELDGTDSGGKTSRYPYVDFPRAAIVAPPDEYDQSPPPYKWQISIKNPLHLTSVRNAWIWVELRERTLPSQSDLALPHQARGNDAEWIVTEVEKPIARWAKVRKEGGGSWTFVEGFSSWREGFSPKDDPVTSKSCNPQINGGDNCAEDAEGWAFYKPEDNVYQVVSTESALLGPPTVVPVVNSVAFDGCGLNYVYQNVSVFCPEPPTLGTTSPTLIEVPVVIGIYGSGSSICASTAVVKVCDYDGGETHCVDICPLLCECDYPTDCGCYNYPCSYRWDETLESWIAETTCPEDCYCPDPPGSPGDYDGQIITTQCGDAPPPTCEGNCMDCAEGPSRVLIAELQHSDNVTGASFSLGTLKSYGNCRWTYNGSFSVRDPANPGGGGTVVPSEVTITKSGSTWTVKFANPKVRTDQYAYTAGNTSCNVSFNAGDKDGAVPTAPMLNAGEAAKLRTLVVCTED